MGLVLTLKRRQYSDQEKQGMSTGKKVALGLGGLATAAGAVYGAKKGVFGAGAMRSVNKTLYNAGNKMAASGNQTIANLGTKAATSGAKDYGKAVAKTTAQNAMNAGMGQTQALRAGVTRGSAVTKGMMNNIPAAPKA